MQQTLDRDKYFTVQEVRKLRKACLELETADLARGRLNSNLWICVDMALSTGCRVGELARMKIEDIDFREHVITVRRLKKKHPKIDDIPLTAELAAHLRQYLGGRTAGPVVRGQRGPLTRRGWQLAWDSACRRAGIRPLSIHKARHTFGKVMWDKTKDLRLVQELLGHSNSHTTEIYAHVEWEKMQRATEKIFDD